MGRGDRARPELPKPTCRVKIVCGPPGAGKTTYVKAHAAPGDLIIDFDLIAQELGHDRNRTWSSVSPILRERNRRLAELSKEPPGRLAWVVLTAPSECLRQWWREALGAEELVLLVPTKTELRARIMKDPDRLYVWNTYFGLVDEWFNQEQRNDPGIIKGGVDENGYPLDPLHPVNR